VSAGETMAEIINDVLAASESEISVKRLSEVKPLCGEKL
jgi:hypothetical protein